MNEKIEFKHEGQTLEELNKSKQDDAGVSGDGTKKEDKGADGGAAGAGDTKKPFHEDPEVQSYIQRQVESRLTESEKKHTEDMAALRTEIAAGKKPDITAEKPPKWFGGNQEQWGEFQEYIGKKTAGVGEGVIKTISQTKQQEETAVAEATTYLQSEIAAIQGDKTLNPKALKVSAEELLKVVLENELIDTKGRWNYRAGWRILRPTLEAAAAGTKVDPDRKKLAGTSVGNDKGSGDGAAKPFKTSEDFKKKRPW